jgi:hypothetical protein
MTIDPRFLADVKARVSLVELIGPTLQSSSVPETIGARSARFIMSGTARSTSSRKKHSGIASAAASAAIVLAGS